MTPTRTPAPRTGTRQVRHVQRPGRRRAGASAWLGHPILLLVLGALITSVLVPMATRGWQNHAKELQIKTTLVTEMNGTLMRFLNTIQFVESLGESGASVAADSPLHRQFKAEHEAMNKAYNRWLTDSAVLGSKLQAYFSDTDLALGWSRLNRAVARLYAHTSSIGSDEATRIEALRDIRAALGQVEPGVAAAERVVREERAWLDRLGARGHTRLWGETQAEVIGRKDALAQRVLDSDTSAF